MIKKLLLNLTFGVVGFMMTQTVKAQGIPEILYYKFNTSSKSVPNYASNPPSGTSSATVYGALAIGSSGTCNSSALIGSGNTSNTDYIDTKWKTTTTGSWTITFWTSNLDSTTTLYYLFSDINASAFRCFSGGVAGSKNLLLRGPFNDVLLTGGAAKGPTVTAFVYDSTAGYIYAYLNGKLVNSVSQGTINLSSTGTLILSGYNSLNGLNIGGLMDEFRFYRRALSATDIAKLSYTGSTTGSITQSAKCSYTGPSGRHTWNRTGTYKDTLLNSVNCDSIITVNLTITGNTSSLLNVTACDFYTSPSKSTFWTKTGTYTDIIKNKAGCDSTITINLTINKSSTQTLNVKTCNSYRSPSGKYVWSMSGTYLDTLVNYKKCDSLITINLVVNNKNTFSQNKTVCNSYKSPSGRYTWTKTGKYLDTIQTKYGCDSIITTNLMVKYGSASVLNIKACNQYLSPSKRYLYKKSGVYKDTLANAAGCDSIITINLVIAFPTQAVVYLDGCKSVTSPSGRYVWTNSGSYNDTIPNAMGCDSLLSVEVTIHKNSASSFFKTSCLQYTSPSGRFTWTKSGKYYDTIPNSHGCDSNLTITLTISVVNVDVTKFKNILTASAIGAQYQWVDCKQKYKAIGGATGQSFTVTAVGDYAVVVTENNCTDTSACITVNSLGIGSLMANNGLRLYPNPNTGQVNLLLANDVVNAEVTVCDPSGKVVARIGNVTGKSFELNLEHLANGVYYLNLTEDGERIRCRFVKQ